MRDKSIRKPEFGLLLFLFINNIEKLKISRKKKKIYIYFIIANHEELKAHSLEATKKKKKKIIKEKKKKKIIHTQVYKLKPKSNIFLSFIRS